MIHSKTPHGSASKKEQEYLAGWQRARAELINFRKHAAEERSVARDRLKQDIIEPLIQLADNMQALTVHLPPALQADAWAQGVLHVARQFDQVLGEWGVAVINEAGVPFDPRYHEAVGGSGDRVGAIVQRGYRVGDRLVRAAKVTLQ